MSVREANAQAAVRDYFRERGGDWVRGLGERGGGVGGFVGLGLRWGRGEGEWDVEVAFYELEVRGQGAQEGVH